MARDRAFVMASTRASSVPSERLTVTVDTTAPGETDGSKPVVTIPEAVDGINEEELTDGAQAEITLPTGTEPGDTVTLIVTKPDGSTEEIIHVITPEEITAGRHVILIYNDPVKDEYMALKETKQQLIDEGRYQGEERKEIAREMGRLLSYPEERIERMLSESESE